MVRQNGDEPDVGSASDLDLDQIERLYPEFIAHAREDVPRLVAKVKRLRKEHVGIQTYVEALSTAQIENGRLRGEVERLRKVVGEYENAITWDTTCLNCSKTLDQSIAEHERAEHAESERDAALERINAAKRALVDTGYFTEEQVGDDIAPRITEFAAAMDGAE